MNKDQITNNQTINNQTLNKRSTLERILMAAKTEFLEKGFQAASLRNIVKTAGVTTGAFYGYYDSKEELFGAVVGEVAEYALHFMEKSIDDFMKRPTQEQTEQMPGYTQNAYLILLDYLYDHKDEFKILLTSSEGTPYSNFLHDVVMKEDASTHAYMQGLMEQGHPVKPLNEKLIHMIESGFMSAFFEVIVHDMPKKDAKDYILKLAEFYSAGWEKLLGVKFGTSE